MWFTGFLIAACVVAVLAATGTIWNGNALHRFQKGVTAEINEWFDDMRSEIAELRAEFEDFKGNRTEPLEYQDDTISRDIADLKAATDDAAKAILREENLRDAQTQQLGKALDQLNNRLLTAENDIAAKPDVAVLNAAHEKAEQALKAAKGE